MGKRSTGKRRGIQRGVAKHRIQSKSVAGTEVERTVLGIGESVYFSLGEKCFDFCFSWCDRLHLVPFTRTATGEYVPLGQTRKFIHHIVWLVMFFILLHKVGGLSLMLMQEKLKVETFMCTSLFLVYFVAFCISLGVVAQPKETMDVLNSWPYLLSCLKALGNGVPSPFDDLPEALKLIAAIFATQGVALVAALLSLVFSNLPTCYLPTMESLGLIPQGSWSRFTWQLIFFPLEYATYLPPMLISPIAPSVLLIVVGVYRIYMNKLRRIQITNLETREKVERLYICMELYNRICYVWIRSSLPPNLFSVCLTIVITTFISIRYTELPFYCYIFFPNTACALWVILFWFFYDLVLVTRDSEDILAQLLSNQVPYLHGVPKAKRAKIMKRAKAMQSVDTPVGAFTDFSITVPVTLWDEIVNQLVFLLTL